MLCTECFILHINIYVMELISDYKSYNYSAIMYKISTFMFIGSV